ncbi:BTAD domain-containing putative transcriptional regulator [Microbacterium sp. NPDC019599]|uniref:nSTAND1 domain-containing NTPase n=1 Tax=Microbacterium sp. NPDC019599 TaxID=3154690 RepID=UPI003403CF75
MDLAVLGVLTLDGGRIAPAPRDRLVLGALAARVGKPVAMESLAGVLWGEDLPPSWSKVVPGCIMRLRRLLPAGAIETTALGYRLEPDAVALDAAAFERLVARGGQLLELGEPDRASHALSEALALWRGQPFAELADWEPALIESFRLDEIRLAAEESLLEARLQSGDLLDAAAEARARVAESPMRERRWVILGLAQYRQGRQADALATIRHGRELLATELGLDPCAELAALEQAILRQDPALQSAAVFHAASAECPYFGLPPAGVDDGERYFGREEELARALHGLERHGVLVVSGSSGVGKSSFVRAGIAAHFAAHGRRFTVVTPGEHPVQTVREIPAHDRESLLIVDQCEQAFANDDPDETRGFFDEIGRMLFRGPLVMAIRADRLGDLADHHGFAGLIQDHLLMLGPLSDEGLRAVIEKPAEQAGLILEPGLVEILVRDADGRSLPLLSHALLQIWERREGRVLSVDGYRASGEIDGAVAQTAEEVFAGLSEDGARQARDILLRLVEASPGGGVICQRVDRASIAVDDGHARVAERLVDARLMTSDEGSLELAHEAVAREWPRLREWLADDVEGQRILHHLTSSANSWDAMGRPDSELYRGPRLSAAAQWRESTRPVLAATEAAFLDAAVEREAADAAATQRQLQQERRTVRRLRRLAGATASLAVIALAAGAVAAVQAGAANERAVIDDARRVAAVAVSEPVYERALLLAVESIRMWDAPATRTALLDVMGRSPRIVSVTRTPGDVGIQQMSLAPDGTTAAVVDMESAGARIMDLDRRTQVAAYAPGGYRVIDAAAAPDGRLAVSVWEDCDEGDPGCEPPLVRALDPGEAGRQEILYGGLEMVIDFEYSPDRSLAAAVRPLPYIGGPDNIAIWRVETPDAPMLLDLPHAGTNPGAANWANAFGRVRFSPDGTRLYASGYGPTAVFDTRTGALLGELQGEGILAVSPDGESVLVREGRTAVRILDLDDPSRSHVLEMPTFVFDGAFRPDGTEVVTTAADRVWVWQEATGALRQTLAGHSDNVTSVAFRSEDELVTAGADGAIITWRLDDWSASFRDWQREGDAVQVPRDERTLVSVLPDGEFSGISADPEIWLERACDIAGRDLTQEEWATVFEDRPYDPACTEGVPAVAQ